METDWTVICLKMAMHKAAAATGIVSGVCGGYHYRVVPARVKAVEVDSQSSQTGMD